MKTFHFGRFPRSAVGLGMSVFLFLAGASHDAYGEDDTLAVNEERLQKIDRFAYEGPLFLAHRTIPEIIKLHGFRRQTRTKMVSPYDDSLKYEIAHLTFAGLEMDGDVDRMQRFRPYLIVVVGA